MNFCTREQERSIKTIIKRFFRTTPNGDLKNLQSLISTELGIKNYELSDFITEDITNLLNKYGVELSTKVDNTPSFKSNVIDEIASFEIDDLFHGINIAKSYFDSYINNLVINSYLIGYGESYINNDEDLTKNFLRLKNKLFRDIQTFLISNGILPPGEPLDLYTDDFLIKDYDSYKSIMKKISDYFFSGENFSLLKSYSGKSIPNIDASSNSLIYEAYFNMIALSNFDTILNKDYNNLINVNTLYYNSLESNLLHNTYTRVFKPESVLYWSNDTHMEESVESQNVKLVKMIANSIPAYDKTNSKTLSFMEMNDFYLLGSIIANFELLHGNKLSKSNDFKYFSTDVAGRFEWYIEKLKDVLDGKIIDDLFYNVFSPYSNLIYSLYNYIHDPELNILKKEKNSDLSLMSILGQVINNTFGASYTVVEAGKGINIQQVYSQDFNNTGLNNTVYSKMSANSYNSNYYNLENSTEVAAFNDVFRDVDLNSSAKETLAKNSSFLRKLRKYTYDKLGLKLNSKSFLVAMESMESTPGAKGKFTVRDLKEKYRELMRSLNSDFSGPTFKESLNKGIKTIKNDSTIGALIESTINQSLFKAFSKGYLIDTPIKGVMNIKTLDGESIPAYKIPNLTYKDTELFVQQREYENNTENPKVFKSLLIKDNPAIVGTATRLELINNKRSKAANKYTPVESFIQDLNYDFYDNIIKNKKFNVIIGAYSDKSTILSKIIDANYSLPDDREPILFKDIDSILEIVRTQGQAYYYDTVNTVLNSYKELFKILNLSPDFDININDLDKSVDYINSILANNRIEDLIVKAQASHIQITAELHYSNYAQGTSLNQLLLDNYKIFSDENKFKEFVKRTEDIFENNYSTINSTIKNSPFYGDIDKYLKAVKINKANYKGETFKNIRLSTGELNPLIRKWMWTNALYRNEYLFISTKGEYMHPIKNFVKREGDFNDDYWNSYLEESGKRLSVMSKRNVTNTSTYEAPVRDTKYSIPTEINIAAIQDFATSVYSVTGDKKYKIKNGKVEGGQDAHDGSSFIDYVYSQMIDASYPSKGYSGTKKQFGTIVTNGGVVIKKDAESVLTNEKIRNSLNSVISVRNLKEKMLSIPIDDVDLSYETKLAPNYFYNYKGNLYRIGEIQLYKVNGKNTLFMSLYQKMGKNWVKQPPIQRTINNLFNLWEAFGGESSTDINGKFNESSNDLLYKIVVDNPELKSKIIHILSNKSALKAGATNLNPRESWINYKPFAYATFKSRFMGPQLDASHNADDSEIKEVTQIISALAQGGFTSEIAREAYADIQNIIKETASVYLNKLKNKEELYKFLTDTFIKSVVQSNGNNIAKVLISNLRKDHIKIPFSNPNFYNTFVKDVITKMNTDFISRYYPGLGAVLVPSEGMIQLYDITLPDGTKLAVTQENLFKESLKNYNENEFILRYGVPATNNYQIFNDYINRILPPVSTRIDNIEIGNTVLWNNKEYTLSTPDEYYAFKEEFLNAQEALKTQGIVDDSINNVIKIQNRSRDLNPTLHSFDLSSGEHRNIFDLNGIKLRYYLDSGVSEKYNKILNNLSLYITKKYIGTEIPLNLLNSEQRELLYLFLNSWVQRDLSLINVGLLTNDVDENTNFELYFANDDIIDNILEDVIDYYRENGQQIANLKFRPAETISPDIYKNKFDRDDISLYEIKKKGYKYFQAKLLEYYRKDTTDADIKIVTSNLDHPVYIRFVDKLKRFNENLNLRENSEEAVPVTSRYNDKGDRVYDLVDLKYTSTIMDNGKEVILIQTGNIVKDKNSTTYHKTPELERILSKTIKSFKGSIRALVPLMRDDSKINIFTYKKEGNKSVVSGKEVLDLNQITLNQFKRFTGYNGNIELKKGSIFENKNLITENLAKIKYASWEKSHDIVASRIPAQSMQSFMPMQIVEYSDNTKNDTFVSVSQIFLQGSDFDVDKAYLLGYSFDNKGKYSVWSNLSNFSTKQQIDALEKLPMPNNKTLYIDAAGQDISNYHQEVINSFEGNYNVNELSPKTIESFNNLIRFINTNNIESVKSFIQSTEYPIESVVSLINKHNTDLTNIHRNSSLKNGVTSKISRIISSIDNQLLANSPVSTDSWHKAVDSVIHNKDIYLKEGVTDLFESNKQLQEVGDIHQYSRFLNTIKTNSIIEYSEETKEPFIRISDTVTYPLGTVIDISNFKEFVKKDKSVKKVSNLSPYDIVSYYIQQYNASVGKDDVGIVANGVKAFFGLSDYYNNFYKKELPLMSDEQVIKSGKIFDKSFSFYDSTNSLRTYNINAIADLQISRQTKERLNKLLLHRLNYLNTNAALNMSGFMSGATDNAKELLMAKVNATTDLSSMHVYLTVLGLKPEDTVEIMTSKIVEDIINYREGNLFENEYETSMEKVIDALAQRYKTDTILSNNLEVFKDLYYSSKELSSLAMLFGVNQKRKANTWEIYKYLSRLERVFNDSNDSFLGKTNLDDIDNDLRNKLANKIIIRNPSLAGYKNYIKDILLEADNITVKHTDYNGNVIDKQVSLLKDGMDFRYYINDDNYKEIVKKYYSLIKHTFNVFDVIDTVPHFKEMINSLVLTHNMLLNTSKKYNFVTNTLKDVINIGENLVSDFSKSYIDEQTINKAIYFFDTKVMENWLHGISSDFSFRIKDLMSLAGVPSYQIYLSNDAKNVIKENGISPTVKTVTTTSTDNPLISLDSAYGIAQFKRVFEDLILPIMQNRLNNSFSDYLKVETVMTPFGTRGSSVVSTFPLQNLNNPVYIRQFQKLLNDFDFLDSDNKIKGIITNSVGKELKLRDLFFIYNLIVNNERYGNKRLTPIFENYMKEVDSLGYKYTQHWSDFEHGEDNIIVDESSPNWREEFEDSLLFHIANIEGSITINREKRENYSINNPDFILIGDVALSKEQEQSKRDLYETLGMLKSKGFIINLKC